MATFQKPKPTRHIWTDTPTIRFATPSAPEAREMMRTFLDARTKPMPGHTVAMVDFVRHFIRCVDREHDLAVSMWFTQKRRIHRVLADLGIQVGYWMPRTVATLVVANLDMTSSRQACQTAITLEFDAYDLGPMLMPIDYSGDVIAD